MRGFIPFFKVFDGENRVSVAGPAVKRFRAGQRAPGGEGC